MSKMHYSSLVYGFWYFYSSGLFFDPRREGVLTWSSSGLYVFPQEQLKHFIEQERTSVNKVLN